MVNESNRSCDLDSAMDLSDGHACSSFYFNTYIISNISNIHSSNIVLCLRTTTYYMIK